MRCVFKATLKLSRCISFQINDPGCIWIVGAEGLRRLNPRSTVNLTQRDVSITCHNTLESGASVRSAVHGIASAAALDSRSLSGRFCRREVQINAAVGVSMVNWCQILSELEPVASLDCCVLKKKKKEKKNKKKTIL
jgi:hypothetical protein